MSLSAAWARVHQVCRGRGGQDLAGALERPWQVTAGMHAPASEAGAGTPGRWYPWSRVGPRCAVMSMKFKGPDCLCSQRFRPQTCGDFSTPTLVSNSLDVEGVSYNSVRF